MMSIILEENKALLADGFEDALIGYTNGAKVVAVYDYDKCIKALRRQNRWDYEDAVEWMNFNVVDAGYGDRTPIFITLD